VASFGISSKVAVRTWSTWSSRIDGGRPGRGWSRSPSNRRFTNRARHLVTVCSPTRSSAATLVFDDPSAQARMILDRSASAWVELDRRAQRCSWSRSSSVSDRPGFGRPERGRSVSPASLDSANRRRTLWTVITLTPSSSASRAYTTPGSEHASTILARTATRDPPPANASN
jgi:hypothetical protein